MSLLEARNRLSRARPVILAPDGQQTNSGGRTMDRTPATSVARRRVHSPPDARRGSETFGPRVVDVELKKRRSRPPTHDEGHVHHTD